MVKDSRNVLKTGFDRNDNVIKLRDEKLKHMQKILVMMIKDFDMIAQKYGIEYTLSGGSVIGALRHKGFIPLTTTYVIKGTVNGTNALWYVKNNVVTYTNTVAKDKNGNYYGIKNGKVDNNFNGFLSDGKEWWHVNKGKVTFTDTGVFKGTINGTTGWYYAKASKYTKATVLAKNPDNNTWWRVTDGKMDFGFTGFFQNENGLWYCKNGQITFTDTGIFEGTINGVTGYYYVKGSLFTKTNTVAQYGSDYWCVQDGMINSGFTGICSNSSGSWYCKDGKAQLEFTGEITYNGKKYKIVKGMVK